MHIKNIIFIICVLAFVALGADDPSSVKNLKPLDGAIVNDCPSFSWSLSNGAKTYIIVIKDSSSKVVVNEEVSVPRYSIPTNDASKFLAKGSYTWNVTALFKNSAQEVLYRYNSTVQHFVINIASCIPGRFTNKIDNTFNSFGQESFNHAGGSVSNKWKRVEQVDLEANGHKVYFKPWGSEKIFSVQEHEHFPVIDDDLSISKAFAEITPDIGDNLLMFRYVFYTTGNSTIYIDVVDSGVTKRLGCIGSNKACEKSTVGSTGNDTVYFSDSLGLGSGKDPKWDVFMKLIEPRQNGNPIKVMLTYELAEKQIDDTIPSGNANYLFIASEFVFGQCSSIPSEYYDPEETNSVVISDICPQCPDAGYRYPVNFTGQCTDCKNLDDMDNCGSIDYCTPCIKDDSTCYPSSSAEAAQCRTAAQCYTETDEDNCESGDCGWCKVEEKCIFAADGDSNCTACSSFTKMADCNSRTACNWCATLKVCLDKKDSCPGCSVIFDDEKCTFAKTDGACQYCNGKHACLATNIQCDATCSTKTSKADCTGDDCQWCESMQLCTETRMECKECIDVAKKDCGGDSYPGCSLCESGLCVRDIKDCPICSERTEDNCLVEQNITLDCKFCKSSQECMRLIDNCTNCSSVVNASTCGNLKGCTYCKSDLVCVDKGSATKECDCVGMDGVTCNRHPKGCCFNSACYDITDERCNTGLSTEMIIIIAAAAGVVALAIIILIPVLICCCKPKANEGIEMSAPGTIVVLPEGQPSMVVAQESLQSVNADPATAVSVDETVQTTNVGMQPSASLQDVQNMQMMQQQMMNTMMQQQMLNSMGMMNPMMMNSMGMMNMTGGMAGMSGMNSMGMDMNSMGMTGGMNSMGMTGGMNSMGMTGGMNSMGNMSNMGNGMQSGAAPDASGGA